MEVTEQRNKIIITTNTDKVEVVVVVVVLIKTPEVQGLLDKVRAEHATRYLQNTRLPLTSIAYMVGFNDASNFRRAYLKWTGHSPKEVRNG